MINITDRKLSSAEETLRIIGMKINTRDANKRDYIATSESKLKSNGVPEEGQQMV